MADVLMYDPNDAAQNYPFCSLRLVIETCGYSTYRPIRYIIKSCLDYE